MNTNTRTESNRRLQPCSAWGLLMLAICLTGCRTAGYHKSDAAALNAQVATQSVRAESEALAATVGTLNDLVNQPAADAKPQFLQFSAALDRLTASARQATKSLNHIWAKRASYFQVWDQEIAAIQDNEIRQRSQTRRVEVSNQFDTARQRYEEAQNSLNPLIAYLLDVRKAISTDLTRNGLIAAQPSVFNANERARQAQTALAQASTELDILSARTSSARVQEAK